MGPRSWVGRDLGDIESGWSVLLRELGNLLLAWNLGYPVVVWGRYVLLRCLWWVFVRFAMLRGTPAHFYGTLGSATDLYSGLNGLGFVLFPMSLPETGLERALLNAPPKDLTTSLGLIQGGSPAAALTRLELSVKPRWDGHRGI